MPRIDTGSVCCRLTQAVSISNTAVPVVHARRRDAVALFPAAAAGTLDSTCTMPGAVNGQHCGAQQIGLRRQTTERAARDQRRAKLSLMSPAHRHTRQHGIIGTDCA